MNVNSQYLLLAFFIYDVGRHYVAAQAGTQVARNYDTTIEAIEEFRYVSFQLPAMVPSPSVHVQLIDENTLRTKINDITVWFRIRDRLRWPGKLKIGVDGKIDMRFQKRRFREPSSNGSSVQKMTVFRDKIAEPFPSYWLMEVDDMLELNHDTCLLTLRYATNMYNYIGVGRHVSVKAKIKGRFREYQYTPVPWFPLVSILDPNPMPGDWRETDHSYYFYVKSYENGTLSKWLCTRERGNSVLITNPQGTFCPVKELTGMKRIFLIAAGTGITPMLSVLLWALRHIKDVQVNLHFFNRREEDMVWKNEFAALENLDSRFKIEHILSRPSSNWTGRTGRISLELIQELYPKNTAYEEDSTNYFAICGQPTFSSNSIMWLTKNMGYKPRNVYAFMGQ